MNEYYLNCILIGNERSYKFKSVRRQRVDY